MYCAYLRKSTDREDLQVDSIPLQEAWVKKTAAFLGKKIERVFQDSRSALKPNNRPEFTKLLKEMKAGKWEGVFVISLDRIARNMPEGGEICYALQTAKVKQIITSHGIFDPTSDTIAMAVHFGQATQFSRNLSFKTTEGQNNKARQRGKWMWRAPAGYVNTMDPKTREKFVEPDEHFNTVKRVIKMVFSGVSVAEAYEKAYDLGLRTRPTKKNPLPKRYSRAGFYKLFEERALMFYAGMVSDLEGAWHQGWHKPLITLKEVSDYLNKNSRQYVRSERFFPFRSMIRCGTCQTAITSQIQKGITYYHCNGNKKGCDQKKYIREDALDEQFANLLDQFTISNKDIEITKKNMIESGEVKQKIVVENNELIFKKITNLEKEKVRLTRMRSKEEISFESLKAALIEIETEEKELRNKLSKNQEITREDVDTFSLWIELLGSLSGSYKSQHYQEKAVLLKFFGLNFILRDGIVSCEAINPLFTPPKISEFSTMVSQSRQGLNLLREYIDLVFERIDEVKNILKVLNFS